MRESNIGKITIHADTVGMVYGRASQAWEITNNKALMEEAYEFTNKLGLERRA
jgi:hypothetical protein